MEQEHPLMHRVGILGMLGAMLFVVWLVGWLFFGKHDGYWHLLMPIATLMMVVQAVRRVAAVS